MLRTLMLLSGIGAALGGECQRRYGGECHSLYLGCPSGFSHYKIGYCDFLQQCCYNDITSGHVNNSSSLASGSCGLSSVSDRHRIVGGHMAQHGEYPWQVTMLYLEKHICGGTLIDNHHVLTAAHCFDHTSFQYWTVGVGITNINQVTNSQVIEIANVSIPRRYAPDTFIDDIALVVLRSPVDITGNDVRTACLPRPDESFEGLMCTVTGWGKNELGVETSHLHEVDLPVISNSLCSYYLGPRAHITSNNMCAGLIQGGKDSCQGDSGGPLVCKKNGAWKLAGIVSWGYGCAKERSPGVYTRVSDYLDWIHSTIRLYH